MEYQSGVNTSAVVCKVEPVQVNVFIAEGTATIKLWKTHTGSSKHWVSGLPFLHAGGSVSCCNTVLVPSNSTAGGRPPHAHPVSSTYPGNEPPVDLTSTATMDFLQELEEAASSLQSTPMHATPRSHSANPFSHSHMDPPSSPAPASTHAAAEGDTEATSAAHFAQLRWSALQAGLYVKAGRLDTVRIWLQAASLQCAMPALPRGSQLDQQAARGPALTVMQDAFQLQAATGVEHSALQDSQGQPLACHIQWKPGISEQQVSVHIGTITAVHVPGLMTSACTFAGLSMPSSGGDVSTDSSVAADPGKASLVTSEGSIPQPSLVVSVSVLGIAVGALSSAEPPQHAVWLISSRLSMHLGQVRARGRPGSLLAGLLALQKPSALPTAGLRVSATGVQLGIVPHWQGAVDPSTLWPLGAQAASAPVEVQALVQGWPLLRRPTQPPTPSNAEPHAQQQQPTATAWPSERMWQTSRSSSSSMPAQSVGHDPHSEESRSNANGVTTTSIVPRLVSVASSALELHLTGYQLAVMASVADAITAEASRQFQQALPQQAIPPAAESEAGMESWLACLSLQTTAVFAMLTLDQDLNSVLARVPPGLKAAAAAADAHQASADSALGRLDLPLRQGSAPAVVAMCDAVVVTVAVGPVGLAMPAVSVTLAEPHAWGRTVVGRGKEAKALQPTSTTFQACLPACDMDTAVVSMRTQQQTTPNSQPPYSSCQGHATTMQNLQHPPAEAFDPTMAGSAAAAAPQQHPSIVTTGRLLAVIGTIDVAVAAGSASPQGSLGVTVRVQSVSLDWEPCHISRLVQFLQCAMLGPSVPVLQSYPPSTQPQSSCIRIQMEVQMLFGQVTGHEPQELPVVDSLAPWQRPPRHWSLMQCLQMPE